MLTPVKCLVPVIETKEFLKAKKEAAQTAPEQIKKDLKEDQNGVWWVARGSGLIEALIRSVASAIEM